MKAALEALHRDVVEALVAADEAAARAYRMGRPVGRLRAVAAELRAEADELHREIGKAVSC
jgi:hypothetical protein